MSSSFFFNEKESGGIFLAVRILEEGSMIHSLPALFSPPNEDQLALVVN